MKKQNILSHSLSILVAFILVQTLYFKFTGAPESVYHFTKLGIEPWGRIGTGVFELIASLLILIPSTRIYGAILGAGLMTGAIASHLFVIGITSAGDGGLLFVLACVVFASCLSLIWILRSQLQSIMQRLKLTF